MALATSKRKFYKLLDNLSSSKLHSPTQASTAEGVESNPNDRPIKRSRMPAASPIRPKRVLSSTSVRLISSTFESGNKSTGSSPSSIRQTTYAPWSHEQFLERLKTFADVKLWSSKPEPIGDVQWAKRGWLVVAQDELACRTCSRHLLVKIDAGENDEAADGDDAKWWLADSENVFIEKYQKLIAEGHLSDCLWRKAGCKDDIYRIKFSDSAQWQDELVQRYAGLSGMSPALPAKIVQPRLNATSDQRAFDLTAISSLFGSKLTGQRQDKENDKSTTKSGNISAARSNPKPVVSANGPAKPGRDPKLSRTALLMSLCGWTGQSLAGVEIASCQKCFTRVGLWLYGHDTSTEEEMRFDPVTLHRSHCPWQNAQSQSGVGSYAGLAGWEILADMLQIELRRSERQNAPIADDHDHSDAEIESTSSPRLSRDEVDLEDKARESRLARLKRAFSVKNTLKKGQRPKSSRSVASFRSSRSMFS